MQSAPSRSTPSHVSRRPGTRAVATVAVLVSICSFVPQGARGQESRDPDFRCDVAKERFDFVARELEQHNLPQQVWLIGDSVFVPITGVRFDEVSSEDRRRLVGRFEDCLESQEYEELLYHMNWRLNIGTDNWRYQGEIERPLAEMRAAWGFLEEARNAEWDAIRWRWARFRSGLRRWMFPSAFRELEGLMAESEAGQELNDLESVLVPVLDRPYDRGLAADLASWANRLESYDGGGSPERLAELRRRLAARLDTVYPMWLDSLRAEFRSMSASLESVRLAGIVAYRVQLWLPELFDDDPQLARVLQIYYDNRNDQLEAATPRLLAEIDAAGTIEAVREILPEYLRAAGDRDLPAARPILERMAERTEALQMAGALGWSEAELAAYERAGHTPAAARVTEIDLYRAVDRWVREEVNLPFVLLDDITDWATPDERIMVTPTNVRLRGCERQSAIRVVCEYQYGLETNFYGTGDRSPRDPYEGLMRLVAAIGRMGEVTTSPLEFRDGRWVLAR